MYDACKAGAGVVLLQEGRPVALGRRMADTELKWGTVEQGMLATVHQMEKWRCYLGSGHLTVVTDHQPNT